MRSTRCLHRNVLLHARQLLDSLRKTLHFELSPAAGIPFRASPDDIKAFFNSDPPLNIVNVSRHLTLHAYFAKQACGSCAHAVEFGCAGQL